MDLLLLLVGCQFRSVSVAFQEALGDVTERTVTEVVQQGRQSNQGGLGVVIQPKLLREQTGDVANAQAVVKPGVQSPRINQVRHRKLADAPQSLKERRSDELYLLLPQLDEVVDRITDLVPLGQRTDSSRRAGCRMRSILYYTVRLSTSSFLSKKDTKGPLRP